MGENFMNDIKSELVTMLNQALKLEHAARIQYLAHAEQISGVNAEPIISRLRELANDESKHEDKFRTLIGSYLGGIPSMELASTHTAKDMVSILTVNLQDEKSAIDFYKKIHAKVIENKNALPYEFEVLEHEIRHIILDEEEHVVELKTLIG
jgi:bacterioferritin (cytochrome b1)